jgi:hypothetical protein
LLLEEYTSAAGIKSKPKISVNNRWKKKLAHVRFNLFRNTKSVGEAEITINLDKLKSWYEIDPELTDKVLRFSIAHEVAHLKQREEYGYSIIGYSPVYLELMADKYAEDLTGISSSDIAVIEGELEKKRLGIKENKPLYIERFDPMKDKSKIMTYKGKIYARMVGYESGRTGRFIIPNRPITDIKMLPKSAKSINIVVFDKNGVPIRTKEPILVSRDELEKYYILTP